MLKDMTWFFRNCNCLLMLRIGYIDFFNLDISCIELSRLDGGYSFRGGYYLIFYVEYR